MKKFYIICLYVFLQSCTTTCPIPKGFADASASLSQGSICKAINPYGVVYRVREIDPDSTAKVEFWAETLENQLVSEGYVLEAKSLIKLDGRDAQLLEFGAQLSDGEYRYRIVLFENEDKDIILTETAGRSEFLTASTKTTLEAVRKFAALK